MKKVLSLLLALTLVLSLCTVCVSVAADYYLPAQIIDFSKTVAGSEINTTSTLAKIFDNAKYGAQNDCWHTKTGIANDEAARTATIMFTREIEVGGLRMYPRTLNGAATPTLVKVIGIYATGEKEIITAEFPFEVIKVSDAGKEENIAREPKSIYFNSNGMLKGIKLVLLKNATGGSGHFNFSELEILAPTGADVTTPSVDLSKDAVKYQNNGVTSMLYYGTGYTMSSAIDWKKAYDNDPKTHVEISKALTQGAIIEFEFDQAKTLAGVAFGARLAEDGTAWPGINHASKIAGQQSIGGLNVYVTTDGKEWTTLDSFSTQNFNDTVQNILFKKDGTEVNVTLKGIKFEFTQKAQQDVWAFSSVDFIDAKSGNQTIGGVVAEPKKTETYVLVIGSNEIKSEKAGVSSTKTIDVAPYISNGSTLIPLRGLVEDMGALVNWEGSTKTITITKGDLVVILNIGSTTVTVNGAPQEIPTAPVISEGRTFIPVRFVSEVLGYDVGWDGGTKTVTIKSK